MDKSGGGGSSRRGRLAAVLGLCLAVVLSACGTTTPAAAPAAAVPSVDTSKLTLATAEFARQTFEPWLGYQGETVMINSIGEKLIDTDPKTGQLMPGLAESWSVSPDIKTWTFKLRPNIPFHDNLGTVTSEDVKFTWEQFTQKASTANAAPPLRQAIDDNLANFKIISPLEFSLTTTKPLISLAAAVSTTLPDTITIQSKKYWTENAAKARTHPVGTGPYKFVRSTPGVEAVVEAVPNHWRKTATFKQVTFKIIQDEAARLAQLASGALDATPLPPKLVGEAKTNSALRVFGIKDTGNINLVFGGMYPGHANYDRKAPWIQADEPAKGIAIRQAMSLAIDRKLILDKLLGGYGTLTTAPVAQFPSNPKIVNPALTAPYDPVKAKQMLAQGGYPNGFDVTIPVFPWQTQTVSVDIAEAAAGMFEAIGLKVKRMPVDYNFYRENAQKRQMIGMVFVIIGAFYVEPVQGLQSSFLPTSATGRLADPAITNAVAKLNVEPDQEKRFAIVRDMLDTLNKEMTAIPLFTNDYTFGLSKKIGAWEPVPGVGQFTNIESMRPQ